MNRKDLLVKSAQLAPIGLLAACSRTSTLWTPAISPDIPIQPDKHSHAVPGLGHNWKVENYGHMSKGGGQIGAHIYHRKDPNEPFIAVGGFSYYALITRAGLEAMKVAFHAGDHKAVYTSWEQLHEAFGHGKLIQLWKRWYKVDAHGNAVSLYDGDPREGATLLGHAESSGGFQGITKISFDMIDGGEHPWVHHWGNGHDISGNCVEAALNEMGCSLLLIGAVMALIDPPLTLAGAFMIAGSTAAVMHAYYDAVRECE